MKNKFKIETKSDSKIDPAGPDDPARYWVRRYTILFKGEPSKVMAAEELLSRIANTRNCSFNDALKWLLEDGIEDKLSDPRYGTEEMRQTWRNGKALTVAKTKAEQKRDFAKIYAVLGPDELQEIEKETGGKLPDLDDYKWVSAESDSERSRIWILELTDDFESHQVTDIKTEAIEAGLLPDSSNKREHDRMWGIMKSVASEMGVSGGKRGYWQRPLVP